MPERPKNRDIPKHETAQVENELSPEAIEMIMKKVADIQAYGTAFHVLNANRRNKKEILANILRDGILGLTKARKDEEKNPPHTQRGAYVEDVKSGELPQIWFDMLGRTRFTDNMQKSYWMNSYRFNQAPVNIALVFDISEFTDGIGGSEDYLEELQKLEEGGSENPADEYIKNHSKIGTYFPADTEGPKDPAETDWWNDNNQTQSNSDEGHVLFGRISPRYFKGIVLKVNDLEKSQKTHSLEEEHDPEIIQNELKKIVDLQLHVYKLKHDKLIPIYDMRGNLLWPKQVHYEDLKNKKEI